MSRCVNFRPARSKRTWGRARRRIRPVPTLYRARATAWSDRSAGLTTTSLGCRWACWCGCWANAGSRFHERILMEPKVLGKNVSNARLGRALALSLLLLGSLAPAACGPGEDARLVITQSTDAPSGADHKGHLSPGVFTGITLSIRNTGAGPARGLQVDEVLPGSVASYVISVANVGSAVAKGVAVSVSLAPGFLYAQTIAYEGNSVRVSQIDPPGNSLLPIWASWDIPGASNGAPGLLRLTFQARVLPGVAPGLYNLTAAVTSARDAPPQPIGTTAPRYVGKGKQRPAAVNTAA